MTSAPDRTPKPIEPVLIQPPVDRQHVRRDARFAAEGEARTRYSLPTALKSASPVGYRTRVPLTQVEARRALALLSLARPTAFSPSRPVTEQELFEECSLGLLTARQSTNFRGHREVLLGPAHSTRAAELLRKLDDRDGPVLDGAAYTHVVLTRPYRTAFTLLLTFVGHSQLGSLVGVPLRALRKKLWHTNDIPSIGYLQELHVGVLADAVERATIVASGGERRALVHLRPFTGGHAEGNRSAIAELEALVGLGPTDQLEGWRIAFVAQCGAAIEGERVELGAELNRKLGANLVAFRSERIQPGVNAEDKAPPPYRSRQNMDVPDELTVQCGRAAYNAFAHWTGCDRERSKELLLLERIDVLTPGGKERLREVRRGLEQVTDALVRGIPRWADLLSGKAFSKNAERGRKAFALAGQRIYVCGLPRSEITAAGIDWDLAVRAVGAAAARSALVAELMGVTELPSSCDLLAGICLMAGPVNQNDIGKEFFGHRDLLDKPYPGRDPTSLLVWTLKAKTVADPIGNEEQLLNAQRQGALVDLRPGPHEVISLLIGGKLQPMRRVDAEVNDERAFSDVGNFVTDPEGRHVPGNRGAPWPSARSSASPWG